MPRFRYRAIGDAGQLLVGELDAADRALAVARVKEIGRYALRVDEAPAAGPGLLQRDLFGSHRPSAKQIAVMVRELATLLGAGLPLDRALTVLGSVAATVRIRHLLASVQKTVRGGAPLAEAMAMQGDAFPRHCISMVRAGEAGGSVGPTLDRLADLLERTHALKETVKSALVYPIILLTFAGLSVVLLLTLVLPQFKPLFEDAGEALPWATRAFMGAGDALQRYGFAALATAAALGLVARRLLSDAGRRLAWDRFVLRLPLVGSLVAQAQTAHLTRTLGVLLANGVPILHALSIVAETLSNRAVAGAAVQTQVSLKAGGGLAVPLEASGAVPALAVHLVRVGEETGALAPMLTKAADILDQEVARGVQRLLTLLVPVLTIALGLLVAGIIGSVLVAILSINQLAI